MSMDGMGWALGHSIYQSVPDTMKPLDLKAQAIN